VSSRPLPYGRHLIDDDDVTAVCEVLRGGALTTGPAVAAFEDALCQATGARYAVACANGTAALHLATLALGLGPGDRVVVPAITFLASANAVRYVGAEVVFADVDPATGLMGPQQLASALQGAGGARAAIPVHLNGQCVEMAALQATAEAHAVTLVEDACHAIGTRHAGARVGDCQSSAMAAFSFHPVKTIAMGEGGAVTTNDAALHTRLCRMRSHGMVRDGFEHTELALDPEGRPNPWYYEMPELGFNYRASDIHCALASSQLRKLPGFVARRQALAGRYDALLPRLAPRVRPLGRVAGCAPAWHLYVVQIDFAPGERARVMRQLGAAGITTQVHYLPVYQQPYYRRRYGAQHLPGAEAYYARALTLPLFAGMEDADVDRVVDALGKAVA
jgi:UDP-4-amino-4,6-dideoxy-N-acetyl-beta-L-altrosamine transaminase